MCSLQPRRKGPESDPHLANLRVLTNARLSFCLAKFRLLLFVSANVQRLSFNSNIAKGIPQRTSQLIQVFFLPVEDTVCANFESSNSKACSIAAIDLPARRTS